MLYHRVFLSTTSYFNHIIKKENQPQKKKIQVDENKNKVLKYLVDEGN